MNAWRACVRLWAFGSAAWLAFWAWNATQCTRAVNGIFLCPTMNGEGVTPISIWRLGLIVLGPSVATALAGWLLLRWATRNDSRGSP